MTATTALYRRYRPDSFGDVIGQEHVTEPLMTALRKNRVNHAYLFSGPRGCGKTTSARILARCLNCAQGPTDTPCGTCPSCIELARGGSGSLDVIEIDAASHGGVDDARDLRERATFAPVRDRYKIFIIDEAHMVTSAGFNALLKIVEEPPEHIKFIFATTEPDKVIGTIRSRTHHYPFRLVPPEPLLTYLELLCQQENVPVAPGVLSLVIRAGGGSVRDTLSVLDQLMAGAGTSGLDYELAVALLGYTHATLLDDVVDAIAASDAATVFKAVDRVIQTGHDPRRFVEDLLERFRDLIIVRAMPEAAATVLRGMPADQIARLQNQAHTLGASELSRAADVTNTALTEMTGATSPRLHLELLCARILLPAADQTERGIAARIDRVERRLSYSGNDVNSTAAPAAPAEGEPVRNHPAVGTAVPPAIPPTVTSAPAPAASAVTPAPAPVPSAPEPVVAAPAPVPAPAPMPAVPDSAGAAEPDVLPGDREHITAPRISTRDWPRGDSPVIASSPTDAPALPPQQTAMREAQPQSSAQPTAAPPAAPAHGDVEVFRRAWPDVLQTLSKIKRSTWALVEPNAHVASFDGGLLTLAFTTGGLAGAFGRADHSENLRQAIHKTLGIDCQIIAIAGGSGLASSEPNPKAPAAPDVPPTSVDEAWGLVSPSPAAVRTGSPTPAVALTMAHSPSPATSSAPASSSLGAPAPAPDPAPTPAAIASIPDSMAGTRDLPGAPEVHAAPGAALAGPANSDDAASSVDAAHTTEALSSVLSPDAGTSSYSDDDWGPPLDEDAPPLDEEPPLDWTPPPAGIPVVASARVAPPRELSGSAANATPAPAAALTSEPASPSSTGSPAGSVRPAGSTAEDPWSRAVEQAPGVWQVGPHSNVGVQEPTAATAPSTVPQQPVAPAVTEPAVVPSPASPIQAARPDNPSSWSAPEAEAAEPPVREPVYAMAAAAPPSPAPAAAAPASPAPAAAAPAPARTAEPAPARSGRQSLYQRLSNSPEAQAGRARVAPGQGAAATSYIQDVPDPEDETIEESGVFGRAAVERILGGKLIDERSLDGSPLPPRF